MEATHGVGLRVPNLRDQTEKQTGLKDAPRKPPRELGAEFAARRDVEYDTSPAIAYEPLLAASIFIFLIHKMSHFRHSNNHHYRVIYFHNPLRL